jgi:hypothetical protein
MEAAAPTLAGGGEGGGDRGPEKRGQGRVAVAYLAGGGEAGGGGG